MPRSGLLRTNKKPDAKSKLFLKMSKLSDWSFFDKLRTFALRLIFFFLFVGLFVGREMPKTVITRWNLTIFFFYFKIKK